MKQSGAISPPTRVGRCVCRKNSSLGLVSWRITARISLWECKRSYQLADDYRRALIALEDSDHNPDVIRDTLDSILVPVEEKAANVAAYTLNIEAEADAIKQAEERLTVRRRMLEKRSAWLREY